LSHEKGKGDKSEFEITYGRNMDATYAYVTRHRLAVDRKHDAFKNRNVTSNSLLSPLPFSCDNVVINDGLKPL
jgi:hypothetical protein